MIKLLLKSAAAIFATILLVGFYVAFQDVNYRVNANTKDIAGLNQFTITLSGKVDDLQNSVQSQSQKLGAFTQLSSSNRLTDFPATYNANLNISIETGTTSVASITTLSNLASIGTITTGVWNGTPITVAYGGTGSTTLSSNNILFGNGTGIVKNCAGYGTSGQFLTSGGNAACPSWTTASIDTSLNYNWTGNHNFAGTTYIKNLNASSTVANPIVLNGISFNTPSSQGAASTSLRNDGSGNLTWTGLYASSTVFTSSGTWVRPAYVRNVKVSVVGGGGGGGGVTNASASKCAGGGGGGGIAIGTVAVSGNVTVTVGAAGAGVSADNGTTGGDSSFAASATLTGSGGVGAAKSASGGTSGGGGGAATGGNINISGQSGGNGQFCNIGTNTILVGGAGGSSYYGQGGLWVATANNGNDGSGYGAGGGGAVNSGTNTGTGGNGTAGIVIVEWTEQ